MAVQKSVQPVRSEERVQGELRTLQADKEEHGRRRQTIEVDLRRVSGEINKQVTRAMMTHSP